MSSKKEITVLIPFFNREKYLEKALQSIEEQTYPHWRVIMYDDGSKDNSVEIAERFCMKYANAKLLQGEANMGVGHARNILLDALETPYACWLDSDDISKPNRLELLVQELEKHPVVFSYMRFFWNEHAFVGNPYTIDITKYTSREGLFRNMCFASTGFRKEIAEKYKFPDRRTREDVVWLTKMINDGVDFGIIKKDLYWVRRHSGRVTVQNSDDEGYREINGRYEKK